MTLGKLKEVRVRDYLVRFALGAAVSIGASVIGRNVGVRFGGAFLAFPAILPASLTLIQDKEGTRTADRAALGSVLGGLGLAVFATVGEVCLTRIEPFLAILLALVGWLVAATALYALLAVLRPEDCDRRKD